MRYRQVGDSGLSASVLGFGCIEFGRSCDFDQAERLVNECFESGITLFDTANSYAEGESERMLGRALKGRRAQAVISTKFGSDRLRSPDNASGSRRYIRRAVDECLQRLNTDYIDLYQIHHSDPFTPLSETLAALDELVQEGKVLYIGSSNLTAWQIVEAHFLARESNKERFISAQMEYGLLSRDIESDVIPVCLKYGIGILAWRPLRRGILAGKYRKGKPLPAGRSPAVEDEDLIDQVEDLRTFASSRSLSLVEVAIGGLLAQAGVSSVLVGTNDVEHLRSDVMAAEWVPSEEDLTKLAIILGREPN